MIKIVAEKTYTRNGKEMRLLDACLLTQKETPKEYRHRLLPYVFSDGNGGLITGNAFGTGCYAEKSFPKDSIISEEMFERLIQHIRYAAERLRDINAQRRLDEATWKGEVVIIV